MRTVLCLAILVGFAALAGAQADAPGQGGIDPPLKGAPAITVLRAASYEIRLGAEPGRATVKTGTNIRMELLGPLEIRADEAVQFTAGFPDADLGTDDLLVLRGTVTVRSNPLVR